MTKWGEEEGKEVHLYTLTNGHVTAKISNYGGVLTSLLAPDAKGEVADVVIGYDTLSEYKKDDCYLGATVGRYANRIAKGKFTLDGKDYNLATNNGPNHLHGGPTGFSKCVWESKGAVEENGPTVKLSLTSPDGHEGYPGTMQVGAVYCLTDNNELTLTMTATTDAATPVNFTQHAYFNLCGHNSGKTALEHIVHLPNCTHYTPVDDNMIPTGRIEPVEETCLDFRSPKTIQQDIEELAPLTHFNHGYDHNLVVNKTEDPLSLAAEVREPASGRVMSVYTDAPGVQLYTGQYLSTKGKGAEIKPYSGFCLEAQSFPDSVNHENFPSVVLRPGETHTRHITWKFATHRGSAL